MFFKVLGPNLQGRDFIVSDLHGCFVLFWQALQDVGFEPRCDRVFSVGDLIDRGPHSFECLMLLREPWFHAVLGNHEAMLLAWLGVRGSPDHTPDDFLFNGGYWLLQLTATQKATLQHQLIPLVAALPLVLRVNDTLEPFNVAHAEATELSKRGALTDVDLAQRDLLKLSGPLTWGRRLVKDALQVMAPDTAWIQGVRISPRSRHPGLSLTYVGHTKLTAPILHHSHVFMDCGAIDQELGEPMGYLHLVEHRAFVTALAAHRPAPA